MSASPQVSDPRPLWEHVIGGIAALGAGTTLVMKLGGADLFWHVRAGQWILEHGVSSSDPFSHTADGPWRYTEALAAVTLAVVHRAGGFTGLILFHALLGAVLAGLVWLLSAARRPGVNAVVVGAFAAGSHAAMAPKPQMFSYLLFALLLLWLRESERRQHAVKWLLPLPLLFGLWANLHRGGIIGVAVLLAALTSAALHRRERVPLLLLVLVLSAAALCLNPAGTFYLTSAFDVVSRVSFASHIAEWAPLTVDGFLAHHWPLAPLGVLALVGAFQGDAPEAKIRVGTPTLVFLGTALLAARSARLLPFVAIAAAPLAARALDGLAKRVTPWARPRLLDVGGLVLALALIAARYLGAVPPGFRGLGVMESRVPVGIAEFLGQSPPPGRMFNALDFGGYLIFALGPEVPVFIDGRNDTLYDPAFVTQVFEAGRSAAHFQRVTEDRDIGFAVVRWSGPSDASYRFLHADPDWVLVHWDDAGCVLVRRTSASAAYLEHHGYAELSLQDAFIRASRLSPGEADARFVDEVREALRRSPESLAIHYLSMVVEARLGNEGAFLEARRQVERLAEERGVVLDL
ncbi:MAG: hypothetical protein AB8I08_25210 [Sandaracinaceae bacterium]